MLQLGDTKMIRVDLIDYPSEELSDPTKETVNLIASSIKDLGQLHAITIKGLPEGGYILITGLKRLLACQQLGAVEVSALVIPESTTEDEAALIHIHENLKRYNLPWYEEVELKKTLHEQRQKEKGVGKRGKKVGWSLRDTAEELGISFGNLSEDLRLAEALLLDPTLRKVKDKQTAKKLLFHSLKRMQQESEASIPVNTETNVVYLGSSSSVLKILPPDLFDACITDPPWMNYKDQDLTKDEETLGVFKDLYRVMKPNSFLYMFVGLEDFNCYLEELPRIGWKVQKLPLIWVKINHLSHGVRPWEYSRDYEPILLAVKGSPVLSDTGQLSSILTYPIVNHMKAIHPHEKPKALITKLLDQCTFNNSLVVDPFAGSGVVAESCISLQRRYVLIERSKTFYDGILKRISNYF